jgi:hypothetical protein
MKAALANRIWLASSRRSARHFHAATLRVAETQSHLWQSYLAHNHETCYVSQHFPDLPLSNYDDYLPFIDRIANGEKNILTHEPVQLFELSSGSTAASKMIPYTRTLKNEFRRGLSAWITDLYMHHPDLLTGPAYWSISPLIEGRRYTTCGIPIGFEDDSDYLGPLGALIASALAVPDIVKHIRDVTSFRYVTLLFLLRCADLRLISVWNPTFLTLLLAPLLEWWDSLLNDIANGSINPPSTMEDHLSSALCKRLAPDIQRARDLSKLNPEDYTSIWPRLALISCWAEAASDIYARELQTKFPEVLLQPKGLLATEAFVSFPMTGKNGAALAVTSHYFEFLNDGGDVFLAHQLEKGKAYSVIVTTGGGLYRYQLNDLIEVTDFYNQVPCFKFIGKADRVSDYFGEKLNEHFVANVLNQLFERHHLSPVFCMLAPDDSDEFHYTLYIETTNLPNDFVDELDRALRANFHYDYCRKLGQLGAAQIEQVQHGAETYIRACQMRGQKLGDIKPSVLQKITGWHTSFKHSQPAR